MKQTRKLDEIQNSEIFGIGDYEFIKFADKNGVTVAVNKDILFKSKFGHSNNLTESIVLERLKEEILPAIENIIGAENVLEFETDLLSLEGSAKHGVLKSKISLPTFDFYRMNRDVFEKHKLDKWWWLATPDSTSEFTNDEWCVCVSPSGILNNNRYLNNSLGVRPFWNFASSIFVSYEK